MLYKIPVFNDVQYSCMRCCTLVCFALICRIKVWMYIILVGVLYLIPMYTSIATRRNRSCETLRNFHATFLHDGAPVRGGVLLR